MTADEENELVRQAVRGESRALERLLAAHRARLLAYVIKYLPADLRAELDPGDIVQEALVDVCRRIQSFEPDGEAAFSRWLVTVTRNQIVQAARRHRAAKRGGGRRAVDVGAAAAPSLDPETADMASLLDHVAVYRRTPSQSAAAHELVAAVERSMELLPDHYREALRLRHIQGLPAKVAAEQLKCTEGALNMTCHRALKALRHQLRSASLYV